MPFFRCVNMDTQFGDRFDLVRFNLNEFVNAEIYQKLDNFDFFNFC